MATATTPAPRAELLALLASLIEIKRGLSTGGNVSSSQAVESIWRNLTPGRKRALTRLVDDFDDNDATERRTVPPFDRLVTYIIARAWA